MSVIHFLLYHSAGEVQNTNMGSGQGMQSIEDKNGFRRGIPKFQEGQHWVVIGIEL